MPVRVVSAEQAAARDAAAIAAGTPSIELMRRAGREAARAMLGRLRDACRRGIVVFTGSGNNGGDGWIVAGELAIRGLPVSVVEVAESRGEDAKRAREDARALIAHGANTLTANAAVDAAPIPTPGVVVDALLGTGAKLPLVGAIRDGARDIARYREAGSVVVALDLPTGLDATTGEVDSSAVRADLTLTFANVKRGHLVARSTCGEIVVLDIGIREFADVGDDAPILADAAWVRAYVPAIHADAHKGSRRRILLVGGESGMAGAIVLAARAAFRSGVGMVRACVDRASMIPLQSTVVEATAIAWPAPDTAIDDDIARWPDALLIGPGLGPQGEARRRVQQWLGAWRGPTVLDADALNAFAGHAEQLRDLLGGRRAVITPHPLEFARLAGTDVGSVLADRWDAAPRLAAQLGTTVLLKGVPTIVAAPNGDRVVCARGTPVLATAGSGDVLSGIATTLLAQMDDPLAAAACAAWMHGVAGEIANAGRPIRGVTLGDVLDALANAWRFDDGAGAPYALATSALAADAVAADALPATEFGADGPAVLAVIPAPPRA